MVPVLQFAVYLIGDGHVVVDPLEHPGLGQRLVPLGHLVRVPAQEVITNAVKLSIGSTIGYKTLS